MARPDKFPRWATGDDATIEEPSEAAKDLGHVPHTVLTARLANWLQKLVYDWLVYIDGQLDGATAGALQTTGDPVDVAAAAPPVAGQALIAVSPTEAEWSALQISQADIEAALSSDAGTSFVVGKKLSSVTNPAAAQDASTKAYTDSAITAALASVGAKYQPLLGRVPLTPDATFDLECSTLTSAAIPAPWTVKNASTLATMTRAGEISATAPTGNTYNSTLTPGGLLIQTPSGVEIAIARARGSGSSRSWCAMATRVAVSASWNLFIGVTDYGWTGTGASCVIAGWNSGGYIAQDYSNAGSMTTFTSGSWQDYGAGTAWVDFRSDLSAISRAFGNAEMHVLTTGNVNITHSIYNYAGVRFTGLICLHHIRQYPLDRRFPF